MNEVKVNGEDLVFGLDIGTRSVVGTVGYRQGDRFVVTAQEIRQHQTRAMLDGQIHDINRVAATRISDNPCRRRLASSSMKCVSPPPGACSRR